MSFERVDTYNKVVEIVTEKLNTDIESVKDATTFENLGADSLDMVEIIMKIEEEFDTEIKDEDVERLTSVDQVVDYIHAKRRK